MVFLVYGGMVCFAAFLLSCFFDDLDKNSREQPKSLPTELERK
jgi:hypothetical protein